jgi:hypothetical protein
MRREQHVHAVEQLDAGAYGYLVSRTALLHPKGETFDVSMGLRGFVDALTKIAAQPDKDFGELVRQRRRRRGLPVAPAGKILPFIAPPPSEDQLSPLAVDAAAAGVLQDDAPSESLYSARVRLAERRLAEALLALEEAGRRDASQTELTRLEGIHACELAAYERLAAAKR